MALLVPQGSPTPQPSLPDLQAVARTRPTIGAVVPVFDPRTGTWSFNQNVLDPTGAVGTDTPTMRDDFMPSSTETGEVGTLGWNFTNGTVVATAPEAEHPGVITYRSSTTANQVASFYLGGAVGSTVLLLNQLSRLEVSFRAAAIATDWSLRIGLTPDISSNPNADGVYLERLAADTAFFVVTRVGGVETRVTTGVTVDLLWHRLVIVRNVNGDIVFQLDNTAQIVNLAATAPAGTVAMNLGLHIIPSTTTARDILLDFVGVILVPNNR